MTQNLVRYQQTGDLHFVTFSCYRHLPYLAESSARDVFAGVLERMRVRYGFYVSAYVVMLEHVHLLVSEPPDTVLATALQAVKLGVTRKRPERPFWQKRYYDFNVRTERKLIEKRRYIHRNPVTRGLVDSAEEWPWSSFRRWMFGEPGVVEVECPALARRRGGLGERLGVDGRILQTHVSESRRGVPDAEFR